MIDKMLSRCFPHCCKRCGKTGRVLCECCKKYIVKSTTLQTIGKDIYVIGQRKGLLQKLVDDYKFNSERETASILADILDDKLPQYKDFAVTFIPTVSAHIRERGFDHMALLAKKFARRRGLKCRQLLYRKNNISQKRLSGKERQKAASQAFGLRNLSMPKKVLLLDDVYTTGSTVKEAKKVLIKGGAEKVIIATICKQ